MLCEESSTQLELPKAMRGREGALAVVEARFALKAFERRSGSRFRVRCDAGVIQDAGFVPEGPGIVSWLEDEDIPG
jgi:hypothetical protein